jgi:REP-associated tyrosine transposase
MPHAVRHILPGRIRHIAHRCLSKDLSTKICAPHRHYLRWVFEAKQRFGLSALIKK